MDRKFPAIHGVAMAKPMIDHLKMRLDALLKEHGKKASPFAGEIGLKPDVIRDIFRKDAMPSAERLAKIADGLDASIDYLLGRTDDPSPSKQRPIRTEPEILSFLAQIEGLKDKDINVIFSVIQNALQVNLGVSESQEHHDRSQPASPHRVKEPSR